MSRTTHRAIRRAAAIRCERAFAKRAAHADILVEMIVEAIHVGPDRASIDRAKWAVDRLRSMLPTTSSSAAAGLPAQLVERLARTAGLQEIAAVDSRRRSGRALSVAERRAWRRIELFASLVATAAAAGDVEAHRAIGTSGAGPVDAS
jgi:hypothetical protein